MRAVNHAHVILSWQEHLAGEEIPPEWMWSLDDELEKHFDGVEEARADRYGRSGDTHSDDGPQMMQNELTRNMRRR